jgi:hypothetical protein
VWFLMTNHFLFSFVKNYWKIFLQMLIKTIEKFKSNFKPLYMTNSSFVVVFYIIMGFCTYLMVLLIMNPSCLNPNQVLEQYLWCITNNHQNNWLEFLSMVEFAYNNVVHSLT